MADDRSTHADGPVDPAFEAGSLTGGFALMAQLTQEFAESMDIESTLARALDLIVGHLGAEVGSLWLLDREGRELACRASVGPNPITGLRLPVTQGIIGRSVRENSCQRVLDVRKDPHFFQKVDEETSFETHSILCAPLTFADHALGAIELVNKRTPDRRFEEGDAHVLQVLAASAALAIANARFAAQAVEHERTRRELELAAEIQRNLLPTPRPAPFPIVGVNVPARTVSGDFFDFVELPDEQIAFCLGDVSGKGMNAALMTTKTTGLYRYLAKSADGPGHLLHKLNDEIVENATRGMFVTMIAGVLDTRRGAVRLANAGHEPPLLHDRRGGFSDVPAEAPPIGILPDQFFPEREVALGGGTLYVFTDGVTEACSESGDLLGAEGVRRLIAQSAGKPLAERVQAILADVRRLELRDDLTLLAVSGEAV